MTHDDTPDDSGLREYLAQIEGADLVPERVGADLMSSWVLAETENNRAANRIRYHVGRVLLHERSGLEHGEIYTWQKRRAEELGRKPRTLRLYTKLAEGLQSEMATALPVSILDLSLREIPKALRNVQEGRPFNEDAPIDLSDEARTKRWVERADRLVKAAQRFPAGAHLLRGLRDQVLCALEELDGDDQSEQAVLSPSILRNVRSRSREPFTQAMVPPLMCYPGAKFGAVDRITRTLFRMKGMAQPALRVFREPFVGGGSIALNMLRQGIAEKVWINDRDLSVAAVWNAVLQQPEKLRERLCEVPRTEEFVLECLSALDADILRGLDLAVAKIVVHVSTMGGKGPMAGGPAPSKMMKWRPEVYSRRYLTAHQLLKGRVLFGECTSLDGAEVVSSPGPALIYVDPPYQKLGEDMYRHHFAEDDHRRLANALLNSEQPWLLSYGLDGDGLVQDLYKDAHVQVVQLELGNNRARTKPELMICPKEFSKALNPRDLDPLVDAVRSTGIPVVV